MQERTHSFGYWLRRRRKALDLTQEALAQRVSCSGFAIRKIEADERRPSLRLAERLAAMLVIPAEERREFLEAARAVRATNRLRLDEMPLSTDVHVGQSNASIHSSSDATPFVGRAREYTQLTGLISRLTAGAGHSVLIEGEPGIGKSRLMRELVRYAREQDIAALATNCYEIERSMPYQPVIDLMTRMLDRVSAATLGQLTPVSLAELAALVPEIGERFTGLPTLSADFPQARQARLPRAVSQLLEATANDRPSILLVDDLQWADEASLQVFHYLARQAATRRMLVIYAFRDEDADSDERLHTLHHRTRRAIRHIELVAHIRRQRGQRQTDLAAAFASIRIAACGLLIRQRPDLDGHVLGLTIVQHA